MRDLTLLHLSDLHCRNEEITEFRIRRDALLKDLRKLQVKPHIIFISGDIAFSGLAEEYGIAQNEFFSPVVKELGIKPCDIVVCPGNHDITRGLIKSLVCDGASTRLSNTETAQTLFEDRDLILPQQTQYIEFLHSLYSKSRGNSYRAHIIQIDKIKVGVAAFDSAWACFDDNTKNRIFLTRIQVNELAEKIKGCDFKIALIHHPLTWFHPSEQEIVQQDLRSKFDIILTGHNHETNSLSSTTPSGGCLELMAPSFFAGVPGGRNDGYNIYSIEDPLKGILHAKFRVFIRGGLRYDHNVNHAPEGEFKYTLPSSAFADQASLALSRKVTETNSALSLKMGASLKNAQQIDPPILLIPSIQEILWEKKGKKGDTIRDPYSFAMDHTCIIYAPPDAGSTLFLEELAQRINKIGSKRLAVYVNYEDIKDAESPENLLRKIIKKSNIDESDIASVDLTLIVDHISVTDINIVSKILAGIEVIPHIVICLKNEVLFDMLAAAQDKRDIKFLRLRYWGPSRLREFATRYLEATGLAIDTDVAVKFIWDSLSLSDLPVTPFLVSLYLRVFLEFGGKITSISFVRLLERLEENSLDKSDPASNYSIYNLRLMLMKLAAACYRLGSLGILRIDYEQQILAYFSDKALDVDATKFVQHLEKSGIIITDSQGVVFFSCIVFFNYYLAQAVEASEINLKEHLQGLHTALRLGDSLAYYAGRHRDEESLVKELMRCLEEEYAPANQVTSLDLEKYIHHLLSPKHESTQKDKMTKDAIDSKLDYEKADEGFEEDQKNHRTLGRGMMKITPPKNKIEKVAWNIMALKTFYNVFRNLEHISAEIKKTLLDRILDFHLQCNMELITLFSEGMKDDQFTSLCAYMVTIGGEVFLSQNVGSASLQKTIESILETTTNDLKKLLLLCIYADLRLPGYAGLLQAFITETDRISILEMGYVKIYELLVRYEGNTLPASLISAFNCAFDRRQLYYGRINPIDLQKLRDKALNEAKKQFLQGRKD
ncbi:MAG: metallophosphoesterase [Candidatus Omnitrophota bacterium]